MTSGSLPPGSSPPDSSARDSLSDKVLIGVTVMPEYFQSETVAGVLDRLQQSGVNAITTSPYVMEPADEQTGGREPPIDAGAGSVRLLDRPLWGSRELWVRTAPSFIPDRALYEGMRYQPAEPNELTRREGGVIDEVIAAARQRGMRVFFQVQAAIPPGYRVQFGGPVDEDRPRLPDGKLAERRVANNGSLASSAIVDYTGAMLTDLCRRYPDLDGIRIDWPEYPPYFLDDWFFDFGEHVRDAAAQLGVDFDALRAEAEDVYRRLHGGLTRATLDAVSAAENPAALWTNLFEARPLLKDWLEFKATLVVGLLGRLRAAVDAATDGSMELLAHAFPPPWSNVSGLDFTRTTNLVDAFCVKLYGMHWGMMVRFYVDQLKAANPQLGEAELVGAVTRFLDVVDDTSAESDPAAWHYPDPTERHPGGINAQRRKIAAAQSAAGSTPVFTLAHGYGPLEDFRRRFNSLRDASPHGVWLNRYGYLSNEKLAVIASSP